MTSHQYFDPSPTAPDRRHHVPLVLPDVTLQLETASGVFSRDGVDPGTKLLLLEAPPPPAVGDIVDLGCGYGPIAVVLARRAPSATIWAVDVNERARELTARNASAAGVGNVRVASPGEVPSDVRLSALYSNPPIRIGKAALHELLGTWLARLDDGAHAWLVVHRNLGSDSLAGWLADGGWTVNRLRSRMGYRLLDVARP